MKKYIKNRHIIHMVRWKDRRRCYVCNQACGITKEKSTDDPHKVTCKNCKQRMLIF